MNYKQFSKTFLIVAALAVAFPSISLAVGNVGSQTQGETKKGVTQAELQEQKTEKTCTMLMNQAQQIQTRLTERISKLTQKRNATEDNIQARVEKRTTQRTQRQASWETKKEIVWDKLEAKASTDEQKAAVAKFIETVQTAVKTKNTAINSIITETHAALQTRNNERRGQIDSQINKYKNTVASISSQISKDCEAGKNAGEIREYYKTQMKQARDKFQNREKNSEEFKAGVNSLRETKKAEIQKIIETFKQTVEDAKTELLKTFPTATTQE